MVRLLGFVAVSLVAFLVAMAGLTGFLPASFGTDSATASVPVVQPLPVATLAPPPPPSPQLVATALDRGVLVVVSKRSQRMAVFKDGVLWRVSPVSTGKRGHSTPAGVFPILQKKVFHRSNLYSNAPMPFMQRLTWSGIAIHSGHLPGYPASHGCIRLPHQFARALYGLTRGADTTVVVTNDALPSAADAPRIALAMDARRDADTRLAQAEWEASPGRYAVAPIVPAAPIPAIVSPPLPDRPQGMIGGPVQTIQLAAAGSAIDAAAQWDRLVEARPAIAGMRRQIVPAVVNARQVYRLRASAPQAHAFCARLKSSGVDCFNVS